jgi:NTE family protein
MGILDRFRRKNKSAAKKSGAKIKLGLTLSGGGAKGFAHIGAIKAFEEAGIDFGLCVGTSAGSIIGALYCAGIKSEEMMRYGGLLEMKSVHSGIPFVPNDASKIGRIVTNLIGDAEIEDLPKPFYAVAVDLVEGKQVIIDKGKVGLAVSASACVPMFFKPVIRGAQHLVDGGLLNNVPADVCKMLGADRVVTVDINPTRGGGTSETGLFDVLKATFSIMSANASLHGLRQTDILIAPDMSAFKSTKKDGFEDMIENGYNEAMKQVPNILKLLNNE